MIGRTLYALFAFTFGLPFMILKWMFTGTRGGRQRQALLRAQQQTNALLVQQQRQQYLLSQQQQYYLPPSNYGVRSPDGLWWWDGNQWQPIQPPQPSQPIQPSA